MVLLFSCLIIGEALGDTSIYSNSEENDYDGDGVDNDLEIRNYRKIDFEIRPNEIEIHSIKKANEGKDEIEIKITYDTTGIGFHFSYESEYREDSESESELQFSIIFRKLIEYTDLDGNNLYSPTIDQTEQEIFLNTFNPPNYTINQIENDRNLYYFRISTADNIFVTHIYLVEEFTEINSSLVTPAEIKLDIEISNFNYTKNGTRIALYSTLKSENEYNEEENTEDEQENYADDEYSVETTSSRAYTGFFSWEKTAKIDGISKPVFTSDIEMDDSENDEQKIYFNYENGTSIYHDPKIGVAGILKTQFPWLVMFMGIIICVLAFGAVAITYNFYHKKSFMPPELLEVAPNNSRGYKTTNEIIKENVKRDILYDILINEKDFETIGKERNITLLPEEFSNIINQFDWEDEDKEAFIREAMGLDPDEIEDLLNEMRKQIVNGHR